MKREKTKKMNHNIGKEIEQCLKVMEFLEESTDDYLFLYDFKTGKIHFTGMIHEKYNLPRKKETYQIEELKQIIYARDLPAVRQQFKMVEEGKTDSCNIECRLIDRNGDKIWISCRGKSRINEQEVAEILFGRISDTVMRQKVDPLTGLLNISCFLQDLENCIQKGKKGYLMVLGIDDLKSINIKQGRGYGNYILKMVAEIMEEVVDMSLSIYRLDGDRYAVNLEDMTKAMAQTTYLMFQEKLAPYCTMSAGVVAYGEEIGEGGSVLYQYAENADTEYGTGAEGTNNSSSKSETVSRDYLVNQIKEQGQIDPGVLTDLTVSVAINGENYGTLTENQLRDLVGNAAGIAAEDREGKISLVSAPFYKANVEETSGSAKGLDFATWIIIAGVAAAILLVIIIVILVIRRRRRKKAEEAELIAAESMEDSYAALQEEKEIEERLNREMEAMKNDKGMELKKNIRDFAEQNPEISAQLLKSWLNGGENNGKQ